MWVPARQRKTESPHVVPDWILPGGDIDEQMLKRTNASCLIRNHQNPS